MFPQIFGKYVLERELASGGMARVYLATLRGAVGFEKRLVVKQIRPELALDDAFVRRFVDEAKIAVELSHPNIVPVYELGVEQGIYYMAMELCEGLTLSEVLVDTGPLDAAEGAYVGIEICRALDYAHRRSGIVHRDVTPRNVLLDEEGAVRLIDFGIAAPATTAGSKRVEIFGSPGHMPPEQIRGERLSAATDVFAVGALLVEAWTGRPPFRRNSFEASAEALKAPLPPLGADHPELEPIEGVIAQTLALQASERPQEAEALGRKLREFSRPFDSGDVAKRLGTRVRRARRGDHTSVPWLPGESSGPYTPAASPQALLSSQAPGPPQTPATPPMAQLTPATPASGPPITRTFAAREDLVEWTRRIASTPPPALVRPSEPAPRVSSSPPAVVEADEPATCALPRSSAPAAATKPFPWLPALLGGGLVAVVALLGLRSPAASVPAVPLAAPTLGASVVSPNPELTAHAVPPLDVPRLDVPAPLPSPSPSPSPPPSVPNVHSAAPVRSAPAATSAAVSSVASVDTPTGLLRLTADPPATVSVAGAHVSQTHSTPVRALKLPAGSYTITFRSPTFGEPVVTRVELTADASRSVHADFRAAIPTVVVR